MICNAATFKLNKLTYLITTKFDQFFLETSATFRIDRTFK